MSANPAVSIFARIELLRGTLQKQIGDELKAIQQGATGIKIPAVKLEVALALDTQTKLNTALAGLKVSPINVPINFVPGGMPGLPFGATPSGAFPTGAASPNFGLYIVRTIESHGARKITSPWSSSHPPPSRSWRNLPGCSADRSAFQPERTGH